MQTLGGWARLDEMAGPWEDRGTQKPSLASPGFLSPALSSTIKPLLSSPFLTLQTLWTVRRMAIEGPRVTGGGVQGRIQTTEAAARARKGCKGKQCQVLLYPIKEKVSRKPTW